MCSCTNEGTFFHITDCAHGPCKSLFETTAYLLPSLVAEVGEQKTRKNPYQRATYPSESNPLPTSRFAVSMAYTSAVVIVADTRNNHAGRGDDGALDTPDDARLRSSCTYCVLPLPDHDSLLSTAESE